MFRKILLASVALTLSTAAAAPAQAHDGGAIAAGIIGGLALGGLAAAAAQPAYGYGYPVYVERPYYRRVVSHCWREPRQSFDDYGNSYWRSVRICEGFRMPVGRDGSTGDTAGVRKPPGDETAGR